MADFTMRPHTFVVSRNTGADDVPVTENWSNIDSGACNAQSGNTGSIGNENEAMDYDYVLFYDFKLDSGGNRIQDIEIKVEDKIIVTIFGIVKTGTVQKWLPGQLTNRIWFNEKSQ